MKNYLKVTMLICFLFLFSRTALAGEKIVAQVNGEPVTISTEWSVENCLVTLAAKNEYKLLIGDEKEEFISKMKSKWLWGMIDIKLQLQEAKRRGIVISDDKINETLDKMVPRGKSEEILKAQRLLDGNPGLTWEQLRQRRKEYLYQSLMIGELKKQILSNINIVDEEVIRYYEGNKERYLGSHEIISFQHYWFDNNEDAQEVLNAVLGKRSLFPSVVEAWEFLNKGGRAGWREEKYRLDESLPSYAQMLPKMKKGAFSKILKGEDLKYHFVEYYGIDKVGADLSFQEVKEAIQQELLYQKLNNAYSQFMQKLKSEANIEIYDAQHRETTY